MSMVFAGFMGAAKEDRIRREDLKNEQDKEERSWQKQLDLLDITDRKQQEIVDRKLGKEAAALAKLTGRPITDVLPLVELYGGAGATEMWQAGTIEFGSSTNAGYTPGDKDSFITAMMPYAIGVSEATGLDPRVVIAQSAVETGWGKSAPNNNFFGIKSHGKSGGADLSTREVINGSDVQITDSFRTYGSMGESVADYATFLQDNPRYKSMLAAPDLNSQIAALGESGYATDPNYASTVASIAGSIALPTMPAQKIKSPLNDLGMGEGGMSFGEDTQMADLGFGSPTPLTMPEPLVDTNPKVTLSTSGMNTEAVQTGPRLVRPSAFNIPELLADATTEAKLIAVENSIIYSKGTPEEKAAAIAAVREQRSQVAALENNSAIDVWDPQRSPAAILGEITTVEKAIATEESIKANPTIPDDQKTAILERVAGLKVRLAEADVNGTSFDPNKHVATLMSGASSPENVLAAKAAISGDPRIAPELRGAALAQLNGLQTQLVDLEVAKAEQSGDPLSFVPRGANGMFAAGQAQTVKKEGGQWVDIGTGQPIDETQGRLLPVDSAADVVKQYNDEIDEIAITVSNGANGARDLLLYRDLVQKNPASVNKYSNILGSLLGEVESAFAAGESWLKADGSYDYGFVDRRLNALQDLTAADRQIAEAQLGAALAVASASGSSGRDLSDNDLKLALQRVGAGISNPEKLVGLLNQQVSRLVQSVETQRSARVDSFLTDNATAGGFQSTPFGMPFSDYLSTQLTDEQKVQLQSALADDRTVGEVEATLDPEAQPSFTVTKDMALEFPNLAGLVGKKVYAVPDGKGQFDLVPVEEQK